MTIEKEKIHFIEYVPKVGRFADNSINRISIESKSGILKIGKATAEKLNLEERFIKFYYEPTRKIIGWKVREKINQEEMKFWKLLKTPKSRVNAIGIKGILNEIPNLPKRNFNKLEVHRYKDFSLLSDGEEIYYVKLL